MGSVPIRAILRQPGEGLICVPVDGFVITHDSIEHQAAVPGDRQLGVAQITLVPDHQLSRLPVDPILGPNDSQLATIRPVIESLAKCAGPGSVKVHQIGKGTVGRGIPDSSNVDQFQERPPETC